MAGMVGGPIPTGREIANSVETVGSFVADVGGMLWDVVKAGTGIEARRDSQQVREVRAQAAPGQIIAERRDTTKRLRHALMNGANFPGSHDNLANPGRLEILKDFASCFHPKSPTFQMMKGSKFYAKNLSTRLHLQVVDPKGPQVDPMAVATFKDYQGMQLIWDFPR